MSDAWIFLSIGDAGGANGWVTLDALIAAADYINHAIPSGEELGSAVSNLVAAALVETDGTLTRLSAEGRARYEAASRRTRSPMQRSERLSREWEAKRYPPTGARTWSVSVDAHGTAYRSYLRAVNAPDLLAESERDR